MISPNLIVSPCQVPSQQTCSDLIYWAAIIVIYGVSIPRLPTDSKRQWKPTNKQRLNLTDERALQVNPWFYFSLSGLVPPLNCIALTQKWMDATGHELLLGIGGTERDQGL